MDYSGSASGPQATEPNHYVASYPPEELNTEFKRKYPPDPFGEEMGPNARVWKVYKDEATAHDRSLLNGWNKTLDILLIFAGLFSAIATAFVIESYKLLQPDYEEYIATALYTALTTDHGTDSLRRTLVLPNPSTFTPLNSSRWLNGLWFTSLILSLVVAFLCILFKQWLEEYASRVSAPSSSGRNWARRRAFYFDGLTDWAAPVLIAVLPLLLHAALFLFLFGLAVLLWTLDVLNACWTLGLTSSLFAFYTVSLGLPFVRAECPSSTPFISMLRVPLRKVGLRLLFQVSSLAFAKNLVPFQWTSEGQELSGRFVARLAELLRVGYGYPKVFLRTIIRLILPPRLKLVMVKKYWELRPTFFPTLPRTAAPASFSNGLTPHQRNRADEHVLKWLILTRPSADVVVVGFQAVAALPPWSSVANALRDSGRVAEAIKGALKRMYPVALSTDAAYSTADVARDLRGLLCLFSPDKVRELILHVAPYLLDNPIRRSPHYDLPILWDGMSTGAQWQSAFQFTARVERCYTAGSSSSSRPHFLMSTALQLLSIEGLPLYAWLYFCRALPLDKISTSDFIQLVTTLPSHRSRACPLRLRHQGVQCRIQCSYEALSDVVVSWQAFGLTEADAHAGLDIILSFAGTHPDMNHVWAPLEHSHLLTLLGSPVFASHNMPSFDIALRGLVMHLKDMAHCMQSSHGLPLWSSEWYSALHAIVTVAGRLGPQFPSVLWDVSFKVPWTIVQMFNVAYFHDHMRILPTDDSERLPLALLVGGRQSTWEMIFALTPYMERAGVDHLANLLAASLCTAARRGLNVEPEFATFVESSHLSDRLCDFRDGAQRDEDVVKEFVTLVRHCNEIRQDWLPELWARTLRRRPEVSSDATLRRVVDEVQHEADRLGPCALCPGAAGRQSSLLRQMKDGLGRFLKGSGRPNKSFEKNQAAWDAVHRSAADDDSERRAVQRL